MTMRVARLAPCTAVAVLFILTLPPWPRAAGADQGGPPATDSTSVSTAPPRGDVVVDVRGESTVVAAAAAWRPSDQVLLVFADGTDRLVAGYKVRKIVDSEGKDRTRFVVEGRGLVGVYPDSYKGSRKAGSVALKPLLLGGAVAVSFAAVVVTILLLSGGIQYHTG